MGETFAAAAMGLGAGILSGAFGVGGAILTTPVIRLLFGRPELIAVGTPLAVVVPTVVTGSIVYLRRGLVDLDAGVAIGLAGVPFAVAGAFGARAMGGGPVLVLTAVILAVLAAGMLRPSWRSGRGETTAGAVPRRAGRVVSLRYWTIGAVAGLVSGLMGLGGGIVIVPLLSTWPGFPAKRAIGTSLVAISILALPGAMVHHALGHVEPLLAGLLALGVVPGILLGARMTAVARESRVRIAFALFLGVTALALAANETVLMLGG